MGCQDSVYRAARVLVVGGVLKGINTPLGVLGKDCGRGHFAQVVDGGWWGWSLLGMVSGVTDEGFSVRFRASSSYDEGHGNNECHHSHGGEFLDHFHCILLMGLLMNGVRDLLTFFGVGIIDPGGGHDRASGAKFSALVLCDEDPDGAPHLLLGLVKELDEHGVVRHELSDDGVGVFLLGSGQRVDSDMGSGGGHSCVVSVVTLAFRSSWVLR